MGDPVIIGGARTGIGRLLGSLTGFSAADLGGFAIKGALDRAGIDPGQVEYVIMGHVLQAGTSQITSRQAAVKAGIPMTTPATTVRTWPASCAAFPIVNPLLPCVTGGGTALACRLTYTWL